MNASNLLKKNKILLFFFLIFFSQFDAQSKRFYYEVNFKLDDLGTQAKKDIMVLEINKETNVFLSNEYILTDSTNTIHKDNTEFAYPKFKEVVEYQKSDGSFNFINSLSANYYEYNAKKKIDWKILNEKKKIGQFEVTKATANFGGRDWTAWFCQEIQLPFGPYVFYGLPGLILEVYDKHENFHFSFIQNKNYSAELNSEDLIKKLFDNRKINIKEKEWNKVQLNYYLNPIPEYKSGKSVMMGNDGKEYTAADYRSFEKSLQNQIKRYNNPIDLSTKVDY